MESNSNNLAHFSEVDESEYKAFYKSISKDFSDPATWIHFKAEGEVALCL